VPSMSPQASNQSLAFVVSGLVVDLSCRLLHLTIKMNDVSQICNPWLLVIGVSPMSAFTNSGSVFAGAASYSKITYLEMQFPFDKLCANSLSNLEVASNDCKSVFFELLKFCGCAATCHLGSWLSHSQPSIHHHHNPIR